MGHRRPLRRRLGTMRFGLRATSVSDVNQVASSLITHRRVIFTPTVEIKDELARTAINITCYDRNGNIVKRVTSSDDGSIEDPDNTDNQGSDSPSGGSSNQDNTPTTGGDDGSGEEVYE